jgi:hypothetical protein
MPLRRASRAPSPAARPSIVSREINRWRRPGKRARALRAWIAQPPEQLRCSFADSRQPQDRAGIIRDNPTDPASRLIQPAVEAGFLADYSQTSLNNLKGLMESSTPIVRNKAEGHGAGADARWARAHLAACQPHQTAAAIRFLAEQDTTVS